MATAQETFVLLHNIRSAHNVGSIFRTADAFGVEKIFLTGYTPTPTDRHGRKRKDLSKTALRAEDFLNWEHTREPVKIIEDLKSKGIKIVGVEQGPESVSFDYFSFPKKACFIFGNEVKGLSKTLQAKCDSLIEIPMKGRKESLNVAVSAGIVLSRTCF